ncbi:Hypothetical predicted protein [Pelobates cultripes]|uniref:Uncharacterized protein n=1 Tax=Pelobates cultripes TaxID=61616 RepID=A0AAD1SYZ2_PELCU|nr:Hypothetical predicted protein [Pelobates cultripes]
MLTSRIEEPSQTFRFTKAVLSLTCHREVAVNQKVLILKLGSSRRNIKLP